MGNRKTLLSRLDKSGGEDACWPWMGCIEKSGYGRVRRNGRSILAHRAVYEELIDPIEDGLDLLHRCDNPACCNPRHLFQGTHADNMADMIAKGRARYLKGEELPHTKLTAEDVMAARAALSTGETCARIAASYGVPRYVIFDIKRRKSWKHL